MKSIKDVEDIICKKLIQITKLNKKHINKKTPLVGFDIIDSMSIVELCIALEDIAEKKRFEFDWSSEKAFSAQNSIFKNITTLAKEFYNQFQSR